MIKSRSYLLTTAILFLVAAVSVALILVNTARSEDLILNHDFESGGLPWQADFDTGGKGAARLYGANDDIILADGTNVGSHGGEGKALCMAVEDPGENPWSVQLRHRNMVMYQDHQYRVKFDAWASEGINMHPKAGQIGDPNGEYWNYNIDSSWAAMAVAPSWNTYDKWWNEGMIEGSSVSIPFTPKDDQWAKGLITHEDTPGEDSATELTFHFGGGRDVMNTGQFAICIDNIYFEDPEYTAPDISEAPPLNVRVNQNGYAPGASKVAIYSEDYEDPFTWELQQNGSAVASGTTIVTGYDAESGDHLHEINFTDYETEGSGFTIVVNGEESFPFDIGTDIYDEFRYDAMRYFYFNRSGIEIEEEFTGGGKGSYATQADYARIAGHDVWDAAIDCYDDSTDTTHEASWPDNIPTCTHTLDVTQGWYDAGDYGKYVVNGGISVWTLMNLYERYEAFNPAGLDEALGDDTFNIPESGNGVPDVLDEARWQMDFLLKMQVPDSNPDYPNMVHHRINDDLWTGLAILPCEGETPCYERNRYLMAPTTAATLNVAATAAQCARIWEDIDSAYSNKCWEAAESAFEAAQENPDFFAPKKGDYFPYVNLGGGPYDDDYLPDDFFWAASELYLSATLLGDSDANSYKTEMNSYKAELDVYWDAPIIDNPNQWSESLGTGAKLWEWCSPDGNLSIPHSGPVPLEVDCGVAGSFNWGTTSALGAISIGTVGGVPEQSEMQGYIVDAAEHVHAATRAGGHLMPLNADVNNEYPWGSNSFIVNNMVLLGSAYDYSNESKFADDVMLGMDYIFGRNTLNKCYVSGDHVCENDMDQGHHRFFSGPLNPSFPSLPAGFMSGGPNSKEGDHDPVMILGINNGDGFCPFPQMCYLDLIDAWSANEVTINWNAPYAWGTFFADEISKNSTGIAVPPTPMPTATPCAGACPVKTSTPTPTPTPTNTPTPTPTATPAPQLRVNIEQYQTQDQQSQFQLNLFNDGGLTYTDVTMRFFMDLSELPDMSQVRSSINNVRCGQTSDAGVASAPMLWDSASNLYYIDVDFGSTPIEPGQNGKCDLSISFIHGEPNGSSYLPGWDGSNDYMGSDAPTSDSQTIPVYIGGSLATGIEPDGDQAPATAVPMPTATPEQTGGVTVNCDDVWNLIDIILIKRFDAFIISDTDDCAEATDNSHMYMPECDVNGDNRCSLLDAVIIQQCNAFVPNDYCGDLE